MNLTHEFAEGAAASKAWPGFQLIKPRAGARSPAVRQTILMAGTGGDRAAGCRLAQQRGEGTASGCMGHLDTIVNDIQMTYSYLYRGIQYFARTYGYYKWYLLLISGNIIY